MPEPKPDPRVGKWFALSQVGLEMALPIFLGVWLDNRFGWSPWGTAIAAILGLTGGLTHLVFQARALADESQDQRGDSP